MVAGLGAGVYQFLPSELAPAEDMGHLYVSISSPHNASFKYTDTYVRQMEKIYDHIPEIDTYFSMGGMGSSSHAFQLLMLKPRKDRQRTTEQIVQELNTQANSISGVRVHVFTPSPPLADVAGGDEGDNVGMVLMTTSDYKRLQLTTKQMIEEIKKYPRLRM